MGGQLLTLKFSREDESEADIVGMELAARAGYDPKAGVTLWQKMLATGKGAPPQFLSTHPSGATRIQDICKRAGVAKGLFYWYFPTKQELFAELVRTMRMRLRKAQSAAMDPAANALVRLRQGSEASVRFQIIS